MYCFRYIAGYLSKVADFHPPHLHLAAPQGVTPVEFRGDLWLQKTRVPGLSCDVVFVTRPHHSAPCRPPLAAHTSAHPVQAVHTGLPVRFRVRIELPAEHHLLGRECGITASLALRVIGRSHRAGDATYNNGRRTAPSPSQHRAPGTVCRTRSVAAHIWLSSNVLSKLTFIFSVFINIVFITFSPRADDIVKCP